MIDPIQKPEAPNEWHYPACSINDYSEKYDRCPNCMAEQIQQLHQEYSILAKQNNHLQREVNRLERLAAQ